MEHFVVKHIGNNRFRHSRFIKDTANGYGMVGGVKVPEYAPAFFQTPAQLNLFKFPFKVLMIQLGEEG